MQASGAAVRQGWRGACAARVRAVIIGLCALGTSAAARAEPLRAAVFDVDFLDTSQEGETRGSLRADETRRVELVGDILRRMLAERGVTLVDLAPLRARIDKAAPLRSCNGCEVDLARDLGAQLAVTGLVQKVSNLIINLNVTVRDVRDGRSIRAGFVDIRGNTDESWLRGMSYLVRNRLSDPPLTLP
jgi:hypothetical protein